MIQIIRMIPLHRIRRGGVMREISHARALLYERPIYQLHTKQLQATSTASSAASPRRTGARIVAIAVAMRATPSHRLKIQIVNFLCHCILVFMNIDTWS